MVEKTSDAAAVTGEGVVEPAPRIPNAHAPIESITSFVGAASRPYAWRGFIDLINDLGELAKFIVLLLAILGLVGLYFPTARLYATYRRQYIGARDGAQITISQCRESISFKPDQQSGRVPLVEGGKPIGMPRACSLLEGFDRGGFVFRAGINPLPECDLGFGATQPCRCQRYIGIGTERQQLFLAMISAFEAPEL